MRYTNLKVLCDIVLLDSKGNDIYRSEMDDLTNGTLIQEFQLSEDQALIGIQGLQFSKE